MTKRLAIVLASACACSAGARSTSVEEAPGRENLGATAPPAAAQVQPPVGQGAEAPGQTALVAQLASCWFESPYEYMFGGGAAVDTEHGAYSMMMAGVRGVLYYGDLNGCAGRISGTAPRSYSDDAPFGALAGLPVYAGRTRDDGPFGYYDPALVEWGRQNLMPDPRGTLAGAPAQVVYDRVFSRFFRVMTEAYLYLASTGHARQEMDAYLAMANAGSEDGVEWLTARYGQALPQYPEGQDGTTLTAPMAIGFWLRRGIDGTSPSLWRGLRDLMERFDGQWYGQLRATWRSPDIEW